MKVVFSDASEADLEDIGDTIARDSPRRALTFVRELRSLALRLAHMKRAFPLLSHYEHYGVRLCPSGNFLIFYRIEGAQISFVRILHGARDYAPLLFPEG